MTNYNIIAKFSNKNHSCVEAKFVLSINSSYMADVFEAVSDYEDGEDITNDKRAFDGHIYNNLEAFIFRNPDHFTAEFSDGNPSNLSLENISNILAMS